MIELKQEPDLLPCPFCGGEAKMYYTGKLKIMIRCTSCYMGLEQRVMKKSIEWLEGKMIEKWNNRVKP